MQNSPIILSVSELTQAIKAHLEPTFRRVWVRGEVTNYRLQSSGHMYFSLIEGGAQLSAVLFRNATPTLSEPLKNGDTVIAEGEISLYAPRGSYQLIVRQIMHVGLGEALLQLQLLKKKLHALGWFRPERKRPLPVDIRTICIVTSPSGAVIHDIINILTRRLGNFHLILNPVAVQGEKAAGQIARAIEECNAYALGEVIIVCRGGGSSEDLSPFNDEAVARACVNSSIPIIAAIGHETDLSITDLVADVRAPTPSAAAELISRVGFEQRQQLSAMALSMKRLLAQRVHSTAQLLDTHQKRLDHATPLRRIEHNALRLDDVETALTERTQRFLLMKRTLVAGCVHRIHQLSPIARLTEQKNRLHSCKRELDRVYLTRLQSRTQAVAHLEQLIDSHMDRSLGAARQRWAARNWMKDVTVAIESRRTRLHQRLEAIESHLQALNPKRTLQRGYAIVFREKSPEVIRSIHTVGPHESLSIMIADGTIEAIARATKDEVHG
jgi:exodeoxyribonuclease VII large subunit